MKERIKIVEITAALCEKGGAEVFFRDLCYEINKFDNVDLTVFVLWDSYNPNFSDFVHDKNIRIKFFHKKKKIDFKCSKLLKRELKKIKPDIIHTHRSVLITYFLGFGFKKCGWKLIHTLHSIPRKECDFFTKFLRKIYIRKKIISFVGISEKISKLFLNEYKCSSISTIYNGVRLKDYYDNKIKSFDLICVARISPEKNHKLLFDALNCAELSKVRLVCLGTGELLEYFKNYSSTLINPDRFTFAGEVDDVYSYLARSSIFILTSFYEGNPISILEAMSFGKPIIASNVGGIPDIVKDNVNGFLFQSKNVDALREKILNLINDQQLQETFKNNNLKDIKNYSITKCADDYLNLFKLKLEDGEC